MRIAKLHSQQRLLAYDSTLDTKISQMPSRESPRGSPSPAKAIRRALTFGGSPSGRASGPGSPGSPVALFPGSEDSRGRGSCTPAKETVGTPYAAAHKYLPVEIEKHQVDIGPHTPDRQGWVAWMFSPAAE